MKIIDSNIHYDYLDGVIYGDDVEKSVKIYDCAKSFYKSVDANLDLDTILYEVYTVSRGNSIMDCLCLSMENVI